MVTYEAVCDECGVVEIQKGMEQPFPKFHACGGSLVRKFHSPRVIYNAPGFFEYDHALRHHTSASAYDRFLKKKERILAEEARKQD